MQASLKKSSKKQGLVWTKPIHIKTTTTKGEKRLGKGKGAIVSYNRLARIKAGACLFELGPMVDFAGKSATPLRQLRPVHHKLPLSARIEISPNAPARLARLASTEFSVYK